jgi:nucleotide-binding universal stress UspA family protein
MRLQRIVIGTDFSESAIAATSWTANHFAPGAELVMVHSVVVPEIPRFLRGRTPPTEVLTETARLGAAQRMREVAERLGGNLVRTEIRVGPAAEQIAQACSEHGADLVVVGRHGERAGILGHLGSTAEQLVRIAPVPVLVAAGLRDAPPTRMLVPINETRVAGWVVDWARFLAERFHAQATALYIVGAAVFTSVLSGVAVGPGGSEPSPEATRAELFQSADDWLTRLVGGSGQRYSMTVDVMLGDPGEEIVAAARRMDADLVVMGSRGLGKLGRALLGSVASYVLRHAPCPTLVVKEPEDATTA